MQITKLSKKQGQIFKFAFSDKYALICDGAVRSGKTVSMITAYVMWAMENFNNTNFALCGKTVQSAERNLLNPLRQIEGLPYGYKYKISTKELKVTFAGKENTFYIFGGKDESSYALIQGLTLAGVLFDEVALMPRSFVEQAIARTLSFNNAKIWFNCNPESPNHWFYNEWILNPKPNTQHLHFMMTDNPILSDEQIKKAESLYSGVFYERYILGNWVRAEGIVFPQFAENPDKYITEDVPKHFKWCEIGIDWGGNGSAYACTCSAMGYDGKIYILSSKKKQAEDLPMKEVKSFVLDFVAYCENKYNVKIHTANCDHIDVIINTLNEERYMFGKTYKPPLEDRVFLYSQLFASDKIKFVKGECDDLIDELQNIVYDDKSERAVPLDDGTMQIDAYDSFTYSLTRNWNYILD